MIGAKATILSVALLASAGITTAKAAVPFVYDVEVHTNFGTKFTDCFTFYEGKLTIAGLGEFVYTPAPTMPRHYYTAVATLDTVSQLGANFAFAGFKIGNAHQGSVHAVGADSSHDSYTVIGKPVPACSSSSASSASYRPAAQ